MSLGRHQPSVETLELRSMMAALVPADTLGVVAASITAPGASGSGSVALSPATLAQGRPTTVVGISVTPAPGSSLRPSIVSVVGPAGERLSVYHPGQVGARAGGPATIFVLDDRPGPVTVNVAGRSGTTGTFQLRVFLPGDVDGSGHVDLADLDELAVDYLATNGESNYNPAADPLQTGVIAQQDARLLLRNLSHPTPNAPLSLHLQLAPGEAIAHPRTYDSGAITFQKQITVLGRTLPNSAVFVDGPLGYYKFNGPLIPTDSTGRFSYTLPVADTPGLVSNAIDPNLNFLVIAPDGRQLIRNYPILRIN